MPLMDRKRAVDLALAVPLFLLSLPVQGVVALAVLRQLGRPVIFSQQRPGLHGRPFTLHKFRSMLPVDPENQQLEDSSRLTAFGALLRSTSLDELPTLWDVIRGDLSLVGPRPLLMDYLDRYTPEQARRHDVRPGLTGLAQVSGRNALTWEEKFRLDLEYVDRQSLQLDLAILAATLRAVIGRRGVTAPGAPTMPEFRGTASGGAGQ